MTRILVCAVVLMVGESVVAQATTPANRVIDIETRTEMFVDQFLVDRATNVDGIMRRKGAAIYLP